MKERKSHFSSVKIGDVLGEIRKSVPRDTVFTPAGPGQKPAPHGKGAVISAAESVRPSPGDSLSKYENAKQLNYNVEFSIDQTVTQIDFNYLNSSYQPFTGAGDPVFLNPGLNLLFMVGITDLMEDYRVTGGVRLNFDLVNNDRGRDRRDGTGDAIQAMRYRYVKPD